jgi:CheY-like chemotaxis protein
MLSAARRRRRVRSHVLVESCLRVAASWGATAPHQTLVGLEVASLKGLSLTDPSTGTSSRVPAADGRQHHILAINNDPAVLGLFRELLEDVGFRVSLQNYVDRDLAQIKRLAPDLIVLDYMWATEDASWSLLQMLRMDPATTRIPIILCTGAVREVEALAEHLLAMNVAVVLKPFNIDHLVDAIGYQLGADRATPHGNAEG